jgi:hypothetical protein
VSALKIERNPTEVKRHFSKNVEDDDEEGREF